MAKAAQTAGGRQRTQTNANDACSHPRSRLNLHLIRKSEANARLWVIGKGLRQSAPRLWFSLNLKELMVQYYHWLLTLNTPRSYKSN